MKKAQIVTVQSIVGDEVVVTKAGKQTHGLGRFFSSLYKRPVPGLAFFSLSLVSLNRELLHIKSMIAALFDLIAGAIAPTHLALDGHFGHNVRLANGQTDGTGFGVQVTL